MKLNLFTIKGNPQATNTLLDHTSNLLLIQLLPSFYQRHPFRLFSTIFFDMGMKGLSLIFLAIEELRT